MVNIKTAGSPAYPHLEYVSGYGEINTYGYDTGSGLAWVTMKDVTLKDTGGTLVNPVVHAGVNFGRLHLPKVVWDATSGSFSGTLNGSIVSALVNSSFIKNIRDAVAGPSEALFNNYTVAHTFVAGKSWVRLNNPDGHKLGGGLRVKKIEMIDNWQTMVGGSVINENISAADGRLGAV